MAATAYEDSEEHFAQRSWSFFFPAALTDTSWLPLHVATEYRSEVLPGIATGSRCPLTCCLNRRREIVCPAWTIRFRSCASVTLAPSRSCPVR